MIAPVHNQYGTQPTLIMERYNRLILYLGARDDHNFFPRPRIGLNESPASINPTPPIFVSFDPMHVGQFSDGTQLTLFIEQCTILILYLGARNALTTPQKPRIGVIEAHQASALIPRSLTSSLRCTVAILAMELSTRRFLLLVSPVTLTILWTSARSEDSETMQRSCTVWVRT
jgi:hypothetical protein